MIVKLLSYTQDPLFVMFMAARNCYSSKNYEKLREEYNETKAKELLSKLYKSGHHSVFEHVSFTFWVDGISRVLTHQLVRHRIASYSQRSQRYTKGKGWVTPLSIDTKLKLAEKYKKFMGKIFDFYNKLIELGIPEEDARFILPQGSLTTIVFTMNLRSLMHFCHERMCNRAQWEIRELANRCKDLVVERLPITEKWLVPKCEYLGFCPEEKSCGKKEKKGVV